MRAVPVESPSDKEADHNVPAKLTDATGYPLSRRRILRQWVHLVRPLLLFVPLMYPFPRELTGPGRQKLTDRAREHFPAHTT